VTQFTVVYVEADGEQEEQTGQDVSSSHDAGHCLCVDGMYGEQQSRQEHDVGRAVDDRLAHRQYVDGRHAGVQ